MNKINSIVVEQQKAVLPDGEYKGIYGGYTIVVEHNGSTYKLETENGVRGLNIPVTVYVNNSVATFEIA